MFTVEQAREVLDTNFGAFADHVVQSGKVASAAFVEMLRLNQQLGVQSKEIADFVAADHDARESLPVASRAPEKSSGDIAAELKKLQDAVAKGSTRKTPRRSRPAPDAPAVGGDAGEQQALATEARCLRSSGRPADECLV